MSIKLFSPFREIVAFSPPVLYSSLYEGFFAQFYSHQTSMMKDDISWYLAASEEIGKGYALDVFSGNGRIAQGFAAAGYVSTAVERSPDMSSFGDKVSLRTGVETVLGDVFEHMRAEKYDIAVAGQFSIAMFTSRSERRRLLAHIRNNLRVGGLMLFDMPLRSDGISAELIALPLHDGRPGYVLVGIYRDDTRRTQTSIFLAEIDHPRETTRRLLARHELVLLSEEELRSELADMGFTTEKFEVLTARSTQHGEPSTLARISAKKIASFHAAPRTLKKGA